MIKLTETQKGQVVDAIESLEMPPSWSLSVKSVFEFEKDCNTYQLQVIITEDVDDFIERNDE
jgi:hypothetical protein